MRLHRRRPHPHRHRRRDPITVTGLKVGKTYRCRAQATNSLGTGPYGALGRPFVQAAKPGAVKVTSTKPSSKTSVTVGFKPGSNGGSKVTAYLAQCVSSNGGAKRTGSSKSSPVTVKRLTTGKRYHCRVQARNGAGTGPFGGYGGYVTLKK